VLPAFRVQRGVGGGTGPSVRMADAEHCVAGIGFFLDAGGSAWWRWGNASCIMRNSTRTIFRIRRTIDAEIVLPRISPRCKTQMRQLGVHLFRMLMQRLEQAIADGD